jgi:ketosteroid isomerase-like protein
MPPNHPLVSGKAAIQGFLQGLLDAGATGIRLDTQRIAAAGDLAWGRGAYTLSMTPPGGAPVVDTGKYVVCYRRQPGGAWRAAADIFNSDGPAG